MSSRLIGRSDRARADKLVLTPRHSRYTEEESCASLVDAAEKFSRKLRPRRLRPERGNLVLRLTAKLAAVVPYETWRET